jgi:iron complex transport system permease protein
VAVAGIIGFVGLVVPHLLRAFTDRRPSSLIVPSALGGALLLLVGDSVCRVLPLAGRIAVGDCAVFAGRAFLYGAALADAGRGWR